MFPSCRVADLQSCLDATADAFDVIGKAKAHLDETTMSMQWEVFGWPQKVTNELEIVLTLPVLGRVGPCVRISHIIVTVDQNMENKAQRSVKA